MSRLAGFIVAAAVILALVVTHYRTRTDFAEAAEGFDGARAFKDLEQLVALGPRTPGSPATNQARQYISTQLAATGIEVQRDPFTASTPDGPIQMVNIVGILPGQSFKAPSTTRLELNRRVSADRDGLLAKRGGISRPLATYQE